MMAENATVTTAEAAKLLGVSGATVTRLYRAAKLRGHKLTPSRNSPLRIYRDSIDEMLRERENHPPAENDAA